MSCSLKRGLGVEAPCEGCACVYWRHADATACMRDGCVLTYYNLIGSKADQTTRWLYDYKLSTERARLTAYLQSVRPSQVISARRTSSVGAA